jgi:hypothetical protein
MVDDYMNETVQHFHGMFLSTRESELVESSLRPMRALKLEFERTRGLLGLELLFGREDARINLLRGEVCIQEKNGPQLDEIWLRNRDSPFDVCKTFSFSEETKKCGAKF